MPASSRARMPTIAVSVHWAFLTRGSANAVTPLETASTPVMAVQPEAKARNSSHRLTPAVAAGAGSGATTGCARPVSPPCSRPRTRTASSAATNR